MIEQTLIGLFLATFIILTIVFVKKSNSIPQQPEVEDTPAPENKVPYMLISLVLFYPVYYVLHDIYSVQIGQVGIGLFSLIALLLIIFFISTVIKYKKIDKLGYTDKYSNKYDTISLVCAEILLMIYLLS
jgi:hypothetical protein